MIASFEAGALKVDTHQDGEEITANLTGAAEADAYEALDRWLRSVHATAESTRAKTVVLDFSQLNFMGSSCYRPFLTWLLSVMEMEASSRYRIRFITDARKRWQRPSLNAIAAFAKGAVEIEQR